MSLSATHFRNQDYRAEIYLGGTSILNENSIKTDLVERIDLKRFYW